MNSTDTLPALPLDNEVPANTPRRRRREELEQLAAEFVNSRIVVRERPPRRIPKAALAGAGGAAALVLLAVLLWPASAPTPVREVAPAVSEADVRAKRLEADRERARQQLRQSSDYLAKMAAVDSALLGEMTARAQNLAARADAAAPASAGPAASRPPDEPTPKTHVAESKAAPAASSPPLAAKAAEPSPAVAPAEPPRSEPAAQRAEATQVAAANCNIHVSELSNSGKLTYADIARMKGARTDASTGHVFTPPVEAGRGRTVVFEVMPSGCVRVARR